ncbi:MAG: polyprenyl synthetase family protein [Catenibacillus sp.]
MNFEQQLQAKTEQIEALLEDWLPAETGCQKTVFTAMNYAINAGGKRLRPMLMAETWRLFGGTNESVLSPFMAAIEMIHTYSLIHDDLPALDNDEYRRGRQTTHVVFGEAMAVLAGDGLLNYAFETASAAFDAADAHELPAVARAMQVLAKKPGIYGMIGGQVVDVERTGQPLDGATLDFIYRNKTSALIECAMMIGAILAGASAQDVAAVEAAATAIGVAFQIQDDILDITGSMEELGKPIGSDEKNDKTTYVSLNGMDAAVKAVERLSLKAVDLLHSLGVENHNPFLKELILWLIHRKK